MTFYLSIMNSENEMKKGERTQKIFWLLEEPLWPILSWTPKDTGISFIPSQMPHIYKTFYWWGGILANKNGPTARDAGNLNSGCLRDCLCSPLRTFLGNVFLKTSQRCPVPLAWVPGWWWTVCLGVLAVHPIHQRVGTFSLWALSSKATLTHSRMALTKVPTDRVAWP